MRSARSPEEGVRMQETRLVGYENPKECAMRNKTKPISDNRPSSGAYSCLVLRV